MSTTKRTYFKGLLLFIVFSLNTVVSFACSFSSLFHSFHHSTSAVSHQALASDYHSHGEEHQHESTTNQDANSTSDESTDDCCSKLILEVEKAEKAVSKSIEAPAAIFLTSFLSTFSPSLSLLLAEENVSYLRYIRWRLPATIQDLRIVIQSFQI